MPYTINGIGTNLCKARGITPWGDCDSVVCFTFFYVPLLPLSVVHTFNFGASQSTGMGSSSSYRQVPLKWSLGLLIAAFLRRYAGIVVFVGGIMLFVACFGWWDYFRSEDAAKAASGFGMAKWLSGIGLAMLLGGLAWIWLMKKLDQRNIDIRYILGCHAFGSSDPAHWTNDLLATLPSPQVIFNAPSFAQAAEEALDRGDWTGAMWAARLCTALENRSDGDALTSRVLNHTHVQAALAAVKLNVKLWSEQMTGGKGAVNLWPQPAGDATAAPAAS